jgi:hypothetical protein
MKYSSTARWVLIGYTVLLIIVAFISDGTYGGSDSFMHYLMARYAPEHPYLFLDQWGKPVYTLLACIPSQFGFLALKIFNILCSVSATALFYRMARRQFDRLQWLSIVFILSVPVYFVTIFSGLTEPLFAACLVVSIYLFHSYRERWACLIVSFLPFIRSEGYLILPLFVLICLYYRKWKAIPLLACGMILFTFIGYHYMHTWNWVFGTNVYITQPTDYGHGNLFHFILKHREISGWAGSIFILAAVAGFIYRLYLPSRNRELLVQVVLVLGSFAVYFAAHSWFWYKGIYGSAGITRVMAGVGPCMGYSAFCGFQFLVGSDFVKRNKAFYFLIWVLVTWALLMPRYVYPFPYSYSRFQQMQIQASRFLADQKLDTHYIYFEEPFIPVVMKFDPFDESRCKSLFHFGDHPFRPSSVIIWDSRLCPKEGMLPLDILEKQNVKLLKSYDAPDEYDTTQRMEIRVYETY